MTKLICMEKTALYFYSGGFSWYDFGPDHPFSPLRQEVTHSLIEASRMLSQNELVDVEPASEELLLQVHTPYYLHVVKMAGQADGRFPPQAGIGLGDTPPFFNMHEAGAVRVGASAEAMRALMAGTARHALNIGGGLHHAFRDRAAGFCVYNDIAIAIEVARRHGWRVAYVDIDAHHGDGVQHIFYDADDVLTISLHETGRTLFPGTGAIDELGGPSARGTSINVPLEPGTGDRSWLEVFDIIVPDALHRFQPDVIVSQHGADAHYRDPLTHMQLSTEALNTAARRLHDLAHDICDGRWLALGGGGYDPWHVVPLVWTALWAIVSHRSLPRHIPASWRERWQRQSPQPLPTTFLPEAAGGVPEEAREVYEKNVETARRLLALLADT